MKARRPDRPDVAARPGRRGRRVYAEHTAWRHDDLFGHQVGRQRQRIRHAGKRRPQVKRAPQPREDLGPQRIQHLQGMTGGGLQPLPQPDQMPLVMPVAQHHIHHAFAVFRTADVHQGFQGGQVAGQRRVAGDEAHSQRR
ncbi:hypothetical protein G6F65_021812 [Rhizopus arrhizus]|nr:hypothetical protein G6F65_021812 [Rhizopus arrhizus]